MKIKFLTIALLLACISCNSERDKKFEQIVPSTELENTFDKTKWSVKDGLDYPYRDQMLKDIVYNDTVRTLTKDEILELLGEPSRIAEGHLYYMIAQKRIGDWPLHTKTLVIKLKEENTIEWIKIHE